MTDTNEKVKGEELGKLVPSGSKMNTTEMLQSTFKYVNSYFCSKRQKLIEDQYCSDMMHGVFDGVALSRFPVLEDHQSMNQFNCNMISDEKCVTVQSIVVRERREGHEI
ncbi:hypothetical protein F3Y22_tig00000910pilonHSYRG00004 [Hibiscus syriacus]|uniref:Uncharacterized protein n=1 Tax=Hibiscus syriacus TaxID=106335 RepID=A0A6A3D414_HIBSY|nr:hypothetical protein F3Y22_tig00000910pilonHSYRG00004 [Hibiscus syriacus]